LDNPIAAIVPVIADTKATESPMVTLLKKQLANCLWLKISTHHFSEKELIGKLAIALSVKANKTTNSIGDNKKKDRIKAKILDINLSIIILDLLV
tara:strand:+ start:5159 stop:5443 length:285 start_codon:yes stop_codon:yes gene_type:complete